MWSEFPSPRRFMTRPSEDDLIARFFAPLATPAGADGLTDDAAVIPEGEGHLVVTKDMLIAGVHFFPDDPPALIAAKALRVNLSDLAAKGAVPVGFLLGLGLPPDWTTDFLAAFAAGLKQDISLWDCPLYGGDTVKVPGPLSLSISAFGRAKRVIRRSGARPGDLVCVTGTLGDGALGLLVRAAGRKEEKEPAWVTALSPAHRGHLMLRYLMPEPRVALAPAIAAHASAAMDISDGFAGDLVKLLKASGAGATSQRADLPLSEATRAALARQPDLWHNVLTGGDDYEILLTCAPRAFVPLAEAAHQAGTALTHIGEVTGGQGLQLLDETGVPVGIGAGRFEHF
jgi:thiamine-monophosphate kinase